MQTHAGSVINNPMTLSFSPQGRYMLRANHQLYVYQVCCFYNSSHFSSRVQKHTVTHATDHPTVHMSHKKQGIMIINASYKHLLSCHLILVILHNAIIISIRILGVVNYNLPPHLHINTVIS